MKLVLLAPLAMVLLSKWQASVETWYIDPSIAPVFGFSETMEGSLQDWLEIGASNTSAKLVVFVDAQCHCTKPTLYQLFAAVDKAGYDRSIVSIHYLNELISAGHAAIRLVENEIPATPTLVTISDGMPSYIGPVTAGNFCTTAASDVLGVSALGWKREQISTNWLSRGCYCQNPYYVDEFRS